MTSFQIAVSPSRRAAGRYITKVRRAFQKALAEEQKKSGLTQSEIARKIGTHRSVINRELRGQKDISIGRAGELAWAMGRKPIFDLFV
jgi:ribosome-binding protein aMBF1 (putative translation factor)